MVERVGLIRGLYRLDIAEQVTRQFFDAILDQRFDDAKKYAGDSRIEASVDAIAQTSQNEEEISKGFDLSKVVYNITQTEEMDNAIICYVEISEPYTNKSSEMSLQKVVLKQVDNNWRIVNFIMNYPGRRARRPIDDPSSRSRRYRSDCSAAPWRRFC